MQKIDKYIYTTVATYIALVLLFLIGVQIFIEFTHEFPALGIGNYDLSKLICYAFLMLPSDIYQFFPIACLLGALIAFGLLAMHSELVVIRVSGVSLFNIGVLIIKISIVLMIIMILLGEVLSPMAQRKAMRLKSTAMSSGQVLLTQNGVWLYHQYGVTHIDSIVHNKKWQGVTNYRFHEDKGLSEISYATHGVYQGDKWLLQNGVSSSFADKQVTSFDFIQKALAVNFNPKLIGITALNVDQRSLKTLYDYIKFRLQSGHDASYYMFAFWQRVFAPLAICVMLLFVIPFIFGTLRSTHLGVKILLGVIMGFGFHVLYQFSSSISVVYHVSPIWAALLPLLLFGAIGGLLILRIR